MSTPTTTQPTDGTEIRSALIQQGGALSFQADYPSTTLTIDAHGDGQLTIGIGLGGDGPHVTLSDEAVRQLATVASHALWNQRDKDDDDDE